MRIGGEGLALAAVDAGEEDVAGGAHRRRRAVLGPADAGQPLAEVALAVGFSSQSHLTRRFKETIGLTPGRYAAQVWAAPEANI